MRLRTEALQHIDEQLSHGAAVAAGDEAISNGKDGIDGKDGERRRSGTCRSSWRAR